MIVILLLNKFKLFNRNLTIGIIILSIVGLILFILYSGYDLNNRDKYYFNRRIYDRPDSSYNIPMNIADSAPLGCFDDNCCDDNMVFNNNTYQCEFASTPGIFSSSSVSPIKYSAGDSLGTCMDNISKSKIKDSNSNKLKDTAKVITHINSQHPNPDYQNTCMAYSENPTSDWKIDDNYDSSVSNMCRNFKSIKETS